MFKIKQKTKPGKCAAMRCTKAQHAELPEMDGLALCHRHHAEWIDAGSPDLNAAAAPPSGATDLVPADLQAKLSDELAEMSQVPAAVAAFPLDTQEQIDQLSAVGAQCKERAKQLEAERTSVTKPLNAVLRTVNGWFKPLAQACDEATRAVNARLLAREAEAKAQQDEALREVEAQGGHADETTHILAQQPVQIETPKGVGRDVVQYTVSDVNLLPPQLTMIVADPDKCKAAAHELHKQGLPLDMIPGLVVTVKASGT